MFAIKKIKTWIHEYNSLLFLLFIVFGWVVLYTIYMILTMIFSH